jgi:D-alanine-D-alanine ligase
LNIVPYTTVSKEMICNDMTSCISKAESLIAYPVIVKPATQGSSIGIKIAKEKKDLAEALITASYYDKTVIIEEALTDMTEINCAAVRNNGKVVTSAIEKPLSWHEFLSFDDKYVSKGKGMDGSARELPAKLPEQTSKCIRGLTERIYENFGLKGVVRTDFMIDNKSGKIYVNEINTVPGSLSYYLFEPLGIEFPELINIMLNEAVRDKKINDSSVTYFPSRVLSEFNGTKK